MFSKLYGAILAGVCVAVLSGQGAFAQNAAGVPPPVVDADHRSAQYRIAFNPDTDNIAQRLHYQQSIDGDFMWRAVLQVRETPASDVDFDYVRGELFWELETGSDNWKTGLRFDAQYTSDDRPGFVGALWLNQFQLAPRLSARLAFVTRYQIGENRRDGLFLQTRANLAYAASNDVTIGVESYNTYGFTTDIPALGEQNHVAGPFVNVRLGEKWGLSTSALLGMTEASPDAEMRLWLTRRL